MSAVSAPTPAGPQASAVGTTPVVTHGLARGTLGWLLLAQILVVLPLLRELTILILPLCAVGVAWRVTVHRGRATLPPDWIKFLLVGLAVAAVVGGYRTLVGLEPAVTLLVAAYYLKLLEMRGQRDLHIVVNLSFFLLGTVFIFDQTLPIALYVAAVTMVVFAVLVRQGHAGQVVPLQAPLTRSLRLLLHAVPLTVLLFLFVPRAAPLWSVPVPGESSRTGLSSTVSVGDVARLGRSGELAFRVTFDDPPPPQESLYWRSLTYTTYENGQWRQPDRTRSHPGVGPLVAWNGRQAPGWASGVHRGDTVRYRVFVEPHFRPWLFGLDAARSTSRGVGLGRDFRLLARTPVSTTFGYDVVSSLNYRYDLELPTWLAAVALQFPRAENPRTRALGRRLRAEAGSPAAFVARTLALFTDQPFDYTLEPDTFAEHEVDGFLFESRRGFCAHYAGAFVLLMRAGGVPARMVGGYQGGEWRGGGEYLSVYQYDAHAWAEVWLAGRGWVRVDPTARVAPERIEYGMTDALDRVEGFLGESGDVTTRHRLRRLFGNVLEFIESIDHRWNIWVVGFDRDTQASWLRRALGRTDVVTVAGALIGTAVLAFVVFGGGARLIAFLRRRSRVAPELRLVHAFDALGARLGLARRPAETVLGYSDRLAGRLPEQAEPIRALGTALQRLLYDPREHAQAAALMTQARTHLSALRRETLLRTLRRDPAK